MFQEGDRPLSFLSGTCNLIQLQVTNIKNIKPSTSLENKSINQFTQLKKLSEKAQISPVYTLCILNAVVKT